MIAATITFAGSTSQIIDVITAIDVGTGVMLPVIAGAGAWALGYLCGYIDGRQMFEPNWRPWRRKARRS